MPDAHGPANPHRPSISDVTRRYSGDTKSTHTDNRVRPSFRPMACPVFKGNPGIQFAASQTLCPGRERDRQANQGHHCQISRASSSQVVVPNCHILASRRETTYFSVYLLREAPQLLAQRLEGRRDRRQFFLREPNRLRLLQTMAGEIADDNLIGANYAGIP